MEEKFYSLYGDINLMFDDSIKTQEFLLCSVDYHKIYEIYKGLDEFFSYSILWAFLLNSLSLQIVTIMTTIKE